jgi:hypothetical protein
MAFRLSMCLEVHGIFSRTLDAELYPKSYSFRP